MLLLHLGPRSAEHLASRDTRVEFQRRLGQALELEQDRVKTWRSDDAAIIKVPGRHQGLARQLHNAAVALAPSPLRELAAAAIVVPDELSTVPYLETQPRPADAALYQAAGIVPYRVAVDHIGVRSVHALLGTERRARGAPPTLNSLSGWCLRRVGRCLTQLSRFLLRPSVI